MTRWSLSIVAGIGMAATVLASATIWMLVSDPVAVSTAVASGDPSAILHAVLDAVVGLLRDLARYL